MIVLDSMAETLKNAGINTIICICVVFAVLIFISFLISLFKFIPKAEAAIARSKERKKAEKNVSNDGIDNTFSQIQAKEEEFAEEDLTDDYELVAVISAAIAAAEGASADGFVVRSIKKVRR